MSSSSQRAPPPEDLAERGLRALGTGGVEVGHEQASLDLVGQPQRVGAGLEVLDGA